MLLVFFFLLAVSADWLSCVWHRLRHQRKVLLGAIIAMVLECLSWAPLWVAIETENIGILIVSVIGSGFGSVLGFRGEAQGSDDL